MPRTLTLTALACALSLSLQACTNQYHRSMAHTRPGYGTHNRQAKTTTPAGYPSRKTNSTPDIPPGAGRLVDAKAQIVGTYLIDFIEPYDPKRYGYDLEQKINLSLFPAADAGQKMLVCGYDSGRGGQYREFFWFRSVTPPMQPDKLRAVTPNHPFLKVGPALDACPGTLHEARAIKSGQATPTVAAAPTQGKLLLIPGNIAAIHKLDVVGAQQAAERFEAGNLQNALPFPPTPAAGELSLEQKREMHLEMESWSANNRQRRQVEDLAPDKLAALDRAPINLAHYYGQMALYDPQKYRNSLYEYNRQLMAGFDSTGGGDDYYREFKRLQSQAQAGNAESQFRLGRAYRAGNVMPPDYKEGKRWLQKAAQGGHAKAQYFMGTILAFEEKPANPQAIEWFELATKQGETNAEVSLGYMHQKGIAVKPDAQEAERWFKAAANHGNQLGQLLLAELCLTQQRTGEAYEWAKVAAKGQDPNLAQQANLIVGKATWEAYVEAVKTRPAPAEPYPGWNLDREHNCSEMLWKYQQGEDANAMTSYLWTEFQCERWRWGIPAVQAAP